MTSHVYRQPIASQPCCKGMRVAGLILFLFLAACSPGPEQIIQDAERNREIEFAVWLPEASRPAPLIVLSHGSGGHYRNFQWLTEGLAANGFAVAAVNHPFNTVSNNTEEGVARAWDRPPDLSLLIDELLSNADYAASIDGNRIGAAGFSSGGYTVLSLAGARYDIARMRAYCGGPGQGPECELSSALPDSAPESSKSYSDPRVKAVFSMAPAWGAATTSASLAEIAVPVSLVATADDEWLNPDTHARYFERHIPDAKLTMIPNGGHFLFLSCDFITRIADWFIGQFNLCGVGIDVDRETLQKEVADMAVDFFHEYLWQRRS